MTTDQAATSLADRLRAVLVGTRQDLEVTRHIFRGEPAYVISDPMTFENHRLDAREYAVFVAIDSERTLGQIFADLIERGVADADDEESFYRFIFSLHRYNFLNLPISSEKLLYERHVARTRAAGRRKWLGFLFVRIPLVEPDAFLKATMDHARFLFSRWFFTFWIGLVASACYVAFTHAHQLVQPIEGVLLAHNLPLLWCVLIVLKLAHEMGHAYACKHFGGRVPEMGVFLIVFTPVAYVDASASWSFSRKRDRIIVCLAGMYVETFFAAIAIFVWAAAPPGIVRDVAYNVMFLAGVVTIGFNINPLMRYDGYYIFSDLVEIPNLRQRAQRYATGTLKRIFLGVRNGLESVGWRLATLLFGFGVAAGIYRVLIVLGIAAVVATKIRTGGLVIAGLLVGKIVISLLVRLCRYLWFAKETAGVRFRAVALSVVAVVILPTMVLFVPVRTHVVAMGVLRTEEEATVRASVPGFLMRVEYAAGEVVGAGDVIAELADDEAIEAVEVAQTRVEASEIRHSAYLVEDPVQAEQEYEKGRVYRNTLARRRDDLEGLTLRTRADGCVLQCLEPRDVGRYIGTGEAVALIGRGPWQVQAIFTEDQVADADLTIGSAVEVRALSNVGLRIRGVISSVAPKGSRAINLKSLTIAGGGAVAVDPLTGQAAQPYVVVTIALKSPDVHCLRYGMTCRVRVRGHADPIGRSLVRRLIRFRDALSQG